MKAFQVDRRNQKSESAFYNATQCMTLNSIYDTRTLGIETTRRLTQNKYASEKLSIEGYSRSYQLISFCLSLSIKLYVHSFFKK